MSRRLRRSILSAFLVFHLAATAVWNMEPCAFRSRAVPWVAGYLLPLGFWQNWGMFAPNPFLVIPTLEADVHDARGERYRFHFPTMSERPPWQSVWHFRHPKFTHEAMNESSAGYREFAARYVVRRLSLPTAAYPVKVRLFHRIRPIPPPGAPETLPVEFIERGTYQFRAPGDVFH